MGGPNICAKKVGLDFICLLTQGVAFYTTKGKELGKYLFRLFTKNIAP